MKIYTQITALIAVAFLSIGGCETLKQYQTPENAHIAAYFVASKSLKYAVNDTDRREIAQYLYSAATALRSLSGTSGVPSPELVRQTIQQFLKPGDKWTDLANDLAGVWAVIYPNVKQNPAVAWKWLESIAAGCEEAAAIYISPVPLS